MLRVLEGVIGPHCLPSSQPGPPPSLWQVWEARLMKDMPQGPGWPQVAVFPPHLQILHLRDVFSC